MRHPSAYVRFRWTTAPKTTNGPISTTTKTKTSNAHTNTQALKKTSPSTHRPQPIASYTSGQCQMSILRWYPITHTTHRQALRKVAAAQCTTTSSPDLIVRNVRIIDAEMVESSSGRSSREFGLSIRRAVVLRYVNGNQSCMGTTALRT